MTTGKVLTLPENFSGIRVKEQDYHGRDFRGKNLSGSEFLRCNFDGADLTEVNCSNSSFVGSTFRDTICYRTNFMDANLGATIFEPKDCYGMTISLTCRTFTNMHIGQLWWFAWLIFATQMKPADGPVKEDIRSLLIGMIGAARYTKLKALFQGRDL